jgi:hypothetical protein
MPNLGSAPYTSGCNDRTYANTNGKYQALNTIVAYTAPIPLPGSSAGHWPNYTNYNTMCYTTYDPPDHSGYGYETLPQFPFRPQPVDMMPTQATAEPCVDPNNLVTQLATILIKSFGIETKGKGHVYQKPYSNYYD